MDDRDFRGLRDLPRPGLPPHLQDGLVGVRSGTRPPGMAEGVTPAMGGHGAVAVKPQAAFTGGLKSLARL